MCHTDRGPMAPKHGSVSQGFRLTGGRSMKHFDITQWADYTRGLIAEPEARTMLEHLDSGCEKCRRAANVFAKLTPLARAEASTEVPEYVVHCAKAIAALARPESVEITPRSAARLLFDSFLEPMPAGVRSQHSLTRQTRYEAGRYAVDLRQEFERGSSRITLLGQIADREAPDTPVSESPVYLISGKTVVAQATSNQFGEFQMEYSPRRNLRLQIPLAGDSGGWLRTGSGRSRRKKED